MRGEAREQWMVLCAQAAEEQDPARLLQLVRQINDILEAKEARLNQSASAEHRAVARKTECSSGRA